MVIVLIACSFFVIGQGTSAAEIPPPSQIVLMEQDYSVLGSVPSNVVLANTLETVISATLGYSSSAGAIEYRTAGTQKGSVFLGIEPFVNGNLTISVKVSSDNWGSGLYITGSTFQIYTQTLADGRARVYSQYYSSPSQISYQSYDVPVNALVNGVNIINIDISGTSKSVTVYHDESRKVTTPMHPWNAQNLPYDPLTLPIVRFTNEKSSKATWVSTYLYGIRESVSGGPVTPAPGNDLVPFGIDVPRAEGNLHGTTYMAAQGHVGVVWTDDYYIENRPDIIPYQQALLDQGWELGIHYGSSLNTLPTADALAYMSEVYDLVCQTFGQAPTTWCSFENKDNLTHARYAYESLGMLWRNAQWYIPNGGSLVEYTWPAFWDQISRAQLVTPAFTHYTDQTGTVSAYAIGYGHFTTWVNHYAGKSIIGFNEYYHRVANQVDTTIQYQSYTPGEEMRFTVQCNEFPSRLLISFSGAGEAVVKRNGALLASPGDYQVVGDDRIVLQGRSGDQFVITSTGAPEVPGAPTLRGVAGNGQADLSWDPPANAGPEVLTYHLYRDNVPVWSGTAVNYIDTGLTNGRSYSYTVAANNIFGWGPNSTGVIVIPFSAPGAPVNLAATPGNGLIELTWSAPLDNGGSAITGYKVYRGTAAGAGTLLSTLNAEQSYTDAAVTNGVTYYYSVSAVSATGEGSRSSEVPATPETPATVPSAPLGLVADGGDAQVVLTWSAPSDRGSVITSYKIYRGSVSGEEIAMAAVGNVLTYTDEDVTNDFTYYYVVSAVNGVGEGPLSNRASATPIVGPPADFNYVLINNGAAVEITGYHGASRDMVIPGTIEGKPVTSIGARAFYGNATMTSAVIPGGVVSIGNYAFLGCSALSSVTLSEGVTSIGERAFHQCTALISVTMPGSMRTIGNYAFYGCIKLMSVTLPEGVTSLGDGAFSTCSALTSVILPASVTSVGTYAFYGCVGLTSVTMGNGVASIGSRAFYQCSALSTVIMDGRITTLGDAAFAYCSGLTSVTFTGGVLSIGNYSFSNCNHLASIVMPGLTYVGVRAFQQCSSLTSVTLPSTVTTIGSYAFTGCTSLRTLSIANGITFLGDGAFSSCSALVSVTIPTTVAYIGNYTFYQCTGLTSIFFEGNAPSCGTQWIGGHGAGLEAYYYEGATGFTNPWQGIAMVSLPRV